MCNTNCADNLKTVPSPEEAPHERLCFAKLEILQFGYNTRLNKFYEELIKLNRHGSKKLPQFVLKLHREYKKEVAIQCLWV